MPRRLALHGSAATLLALLLLSGAAPARAQSTDSATVKLIQLLIAKGILSKGQAASLLSQAQSEAAAPRRAPAGAGALSTAEPPGPLVPRGTVRVTYVPPIVRDQIAAQVREQVLGEEQRNNWAAPNALPEWTKRVTVYGDVRLRGERVLEDPSNKVNEKISQGPPPVFGAYPFQDFNSINNGSPFDVINGTGLPPILNSTENRTRFRIRARLGVRADVDDWISTDFRLATGNDTSPVTENQTLGQNGPFDKYSIWLDRATVLLKVPEDAKYDPRSSLKLYGGRFGNPFWTTDLEYSPDVNFDGAALQAVAPITQTVNAWATGGAFAVYNTAFNYGNTTSLLGEFPSRDKYLFAAQAGVDWKTAPAITSKFAVGLFDYSNVEGKLSSPCTLATTSDVCDTDNSRAQFLQFGNTLFPVRNISAGSLLGSSGAPIDPQYYGLASRFDVLDLHGRMDFTHYHPYDVELEAEYSKNLGFNRSAVAAKAPVNNFGNVPQSSSGSGVITNVQGPYAGGDTAWMVKLEVGQPEITRLNQWNVYLEYKHLDTDSVLDALTDSDFHGGGTNAKGFVIGADYGIGKNTYLAAHWYSANQVVGPAYRNDIVQVDLNSKF